MATLTKIKYTNQTDHLPSRMKAVIDYCLRPEKTNTEENAHSVSGLNLEMRGHIRNLQEQTDKAFRQTQAEYARQVEKLNEEYTSLVQRTDKREKVMFWTSLICSLFPLALVFFWLALQG